MHTSGRAGAFARSQGRGQTRARRHGTLVECGGDESLARSMFVNLAAGRPQLHVVAVCVCPRGAGRAG